MSFKRSRFAQWTPPFVLYGGVVLLLYATSAFLFWGLVSHRIPLLPAWGWAVFVVGLGAIGFVLWKHRDGDLIEREALVQDVDQRETRVVEREDAVAVRAQHVEERDRQNEALSHKLRTEEKERVERRSDELRTLKERHEPKHEWFLKAMHWHENDRPPDAEHRKAYVARNIYKYLNESFQAGVEKEYFDRGDLLFTVAGRETLAIYARDHWKDEFTRPLHIGDLYAIITEAWDFPHKCVLLARQMGEELKDVPEKLTRHYYPEAEGLYFKDKEEAQRRLQAKVDEAVRVCREDCDDLTRRDVPESEAHEKALTTYRSRTLVYQEAADDQEVELHIPENPFIA
jgi:hypothetical protein